LIDTGCGPYFGPTAGRLLHNLSAAGLSPVQIDTILLTHIHPDHSAGLTDLSNDGLVFPNAALVMHQDELEHWFDDARMAAAAELGGDFFFRTGREQVEPYRDRWRPFQGTVEVFPGVNAMPLPGHTPGHTGYLVESQGDRLLIWGDIIHIPEIQVARPEVTMTFDCDQTQAALTRATLFEDVASSALLVAGAHIDFPGFAHVVRCGTKFHLLPEPWTDTL
jgi:glyoxylase-like metal-dependent hydrolase (beta-lactamase superfamily II)